MSAQDDFTRVFIWVLSLLVLFTIIVALVARSVGLDENSGSMTDKDIDARTVPYGSVSVAGSAEAAAPAAATEAAPAPEMAPPAPAPEPEPVAEVAAAAETAPAEAAPAIDGEALYKTACISCHGSGVMGAPRVGDMTTWGSRLANGIDQAVANAISGKGAMPPKGGRLDFTDDEIRAIVDYMTSAPN